MTLLYFHTLVYGTKEKQFYLLYQLGLILKQQKKSRRHIKWARIPRRLKLNFIPFKLNSTAILLPPMPRETAALRIPPPFPIVFVQSKMDGDCPVMLCFLLNSFRAIYFSFPPFRDLYEIGAPQVH